VTMGLLLDRLPIADALYRAGLSLLPRRPSAPLVSGMALGALLGPMNGSVGASVLALARVVAPRLAEGAVPKPTQFAAVAVAITPVALLTLLGGVATGYFYAVEAAAMGAFVLLSAGFVTGALRGAVLRGVLHDALAITGALFALLIAATTLTLVLRLLGTDRLVSDWITGIPGSELVVVAIV